MSGGQHTPAAHTPLSRSAAAAPQPITVRVMRLSRPLLSTRQPELPVPQPGPDRDGCGALDVLPAACDGGSIVGDELTIPAVFGRVSTGMALCFLVSLANTSAAPVPAVGVRVQLQRKERRAGAPAPVLATLVDTAAAPLPVLRPGEHADYACHVTVHDAGTLCLVCTVSYDRPTSPQQQLQQQTPGAIDPVPAMPTSGSGGTTPAAGATTRQSFNKHFNFVVTKDLQISVRTVSLFPAAGHTWLVEATVESLVPVNVTRIALDPDPVRPDLCVDDLSDDRAGARDGLLRQQPQQQQQQSPLTQPPQAGEGLRWNLDNFPAHLPRVSDVPGLLAEKSALRRVFRVRAGPGAPPPPARLGVLHVEWRTAQCEHGHVQQDVCCAASATPAAAAAGLDVAVRCPAPRVALLEPFDAVCTVTNTAAHTAALRIAYSETRELPPATVAALAAALAPDSPSTSSAAAPTAPSDDPAANNAAQQQTPQPCGMLLSGTPFSLDPVVLLPGAQHRHVLTLLPVQLGTCSLGSLLFYDTNTGTATPCPDIGSVFVAPPQQG